MLGWAVWFKFLCNEIIVTIWLLTLISVSFVNCLHCLVTHNVKGMFSKYTGSSRYSFQGVPERSWKNLKNRGKSRTAFWLFRQNRGNWKFRTLRCTLERSSMKLENLGLYGEKSGKIEEIVISGLQKTTLRDPEWCWKIRHCVVINPTKLVKLQIQDLKKQS